MDYLKKGISTSFNLTCGLQIALILIPSITLFGYSFSNESTTNDNGGRTERSDSHRVAETLTAFNWVSMNGVDVLKLLSRMEADTSSIASWLERSHTILILSRDKFSQWKKTLNTDISSSVCFAGYWGHTIKVWWVEERHVTRHKFLLVTVKEWLKSVLNYRSYPKIKLGIRFLDYPVYSLTS